MVAILLLVSDANGFIDQEEKLSDKKFELFEKWGGENEKISARIRGRSWPIDPHRGTIGCTRLAAENNDQDARSIPRRRRHRCGRANCRKVSTGAVAPDDHRREPRRRERRHWPAGTQASRSGRLHDRNDVRYADDGQSMDLQEF